MLHQGIEIIHNTYKSCNGLISTDTRNILPGSMFFCLKGQTYNGNEFAAEALEKGAAFVVADEDIAMVSDRVIRVPDVLAALQGLAHYHRKQLKTHILAVGGSNGKTTTKELCLSVLGTVKNVKGTAGNLNNHIGVPLTLLALTGQEDVAIIETGTNHPGEMKVLCDIIAPDAGIVTNVGKEHLEGFGDIAAVAHEESELYYTLQALHKSAFVNIDDPWLAPFAQQLQHTFTYGIHHNADLMGRVVESMPWLQFELSYKGQNYGPFTAHIGGAYNLYNILAAVAAGMSLGMDIQAAALAACAYAPSNNRSEWRKVGEKMIWLDAYNANPSSMELALQSFAELTGPKVAMLGDMLELGDHSLVEHENIAQLASELEIDAVYLCGPEFEQTAQLGLNKVKYYKNSEALTEWLVQHPISASYILVKGSRGVRMEKVLHAFS